jgi:hypothetical protein
MDEPIQFDRSSNVLYHGVALRHVVELPVLGVPVRFESNSAAAVAVVEDAFGMWRALRTNPELITRQGVVVRLIVHEGDEGDASHAPVTCRMPDPERLVVHTPGSVGIVDTRRGDAIAYVTPALLGDRPHVRYALLEGLTLTLVTACDRYPVHAAAVGRGQVALLLAGAPGMGKSTLAYQAYRQGLRVLSDDAVYVQLDPEFRLWGIPGRVHLLTTGGAHFSELAGRAPSLLANGDEKMVVEFPDAWPAVGAALPVASRVGVCLLERGGGGASRAPASSLEVQAFLKEGLGLSRVRFAGGLDDAVARLASAGGWRLSLSANPAEAIPHLDAMLKELESRLH